MKALLFHKFRNICINTILWTRNTNCFTIFVHRSFRRKSHSDCEYHRVPRPRKLGLNPISVQYCTVNTKATCRHCCFKPYYCTALYCTVDTKATCRHCCFLDPITVQYCTVDTKATCRHWCFQCEIILERCGCVYNRKTFFLHFFLCTIVQIYLNIDDK